MGQNHEKGMLTGVYFPGLALHRKHPVSRSRAEGAAARPEVRNSPSSGGISGRATSSATSAPTRAVSYIGCRAGAGMAGWSRSSRSRHSPRVSAWSAGRFKLDNVTVEAKAVYSHSGAQDLFVPEGHSPGASLTQKAVEAGEFHDLVGAGGGARRILCCERQNCAAQDRRRGRRARGAARVPSKSCASTGRCWCSNARTAISRPAMSGMCLPGWKPSAIAAASSAATGSSRCRNSMREVHQRQHGEWFWKSRDYCNNFIFRKPRGRNDTAH